jgi:hypothetical protein
VSAVLDLTRGLVGPRRGGVRLGLLAAAQLFVGEELLFDTVLAVGVLLAVLSLSGAATPAAARRLAGGVGVALGVGALVVGYPVWVQLHGPLAQHGSAFARDFYTADLADLVTPSRLHLLHGASPASVARIGLPEYLGYLGWPLMLALLLAGVLGRRDRRVRTAVLTTGLLAVLSLGETLRVQGHDTGLPLPWATLRHLPLAQNALPVRFGLLTALAAAVALAVAIDWIAARSGFPVAVSLAVIVALPLLPGPLPTTGSAALPSSLRTAFAALPPGSAVLVLPLPTATDTTAMRWQAQTGFRFRMLGGYFTGPAWDGRAYIGGDVPRPTAQLLTQLARTGTADPGRLSDRTAFGHDLSYWGLSAVVLGPAPHRQALVSYLVTMLGAPDLQVGETDVWRTPGGRRNQGWTCWPPRPERTKPPHRGHGARPLTSTGTSTGPVEVHHC